MLYTKQQYRFEPFVYNGFQTFLDITDTILDNSGHAFNFYWFLVVPKEQAHKSLNFSDIVLFMTLDS